MLSYRRETARQGALVLAESERWEPGELVIKIKTCTYQLCKQQSADTDVLIGRYHYWHNGRYRLSTNYRCISV